MIGELRYQSSNINFNYAHLFLQLVEVWLRLWNHLQVLIPLHCVRLDTVWIMADSVPGPAFNMPMLIKMGSVCLLMICIHQNNPFRTVLIMITIHISTENVAEFLTK